MVVKAPAGGNSVIDLPAGHTILDYRAKDFPATGNRTTVGGLRAMTLEHALVRVSESFYRTYARPGGGLGADPEDIGNQGAFLLGKASDAAKLAPGLSRGQVFDPRQGIAATTFYDQITAFFAD